MDDRQTEHPDHGDDLEIVRRLLADAPSTAPDALLPLLHEVQRRVGHISHGAIRLIADACNLSRAEVHGVVTFYHDFQTAPGARHRVWLYREQSREILGRRQIRVLRTALRQWCANVMRPREEPMKAVARLIRRHFEGITAWARTRSTNGFLEALNGVFQATERKTLGHRRLSTISTLILFLVGKLDFSRINHHLGAKPT
ncbi:MAG: transposase [Gemmatimonadales bacterium]|nr:transposase [Gemmatimonadales bacterium]